jgi:hypothetical protein
VSDNPLTIVDPLGLDICTYNQSSHQAGCVRQSKWHNFWYGNTYKLHADNGKTYNLLQPLKELSGGRKYTILGPEKTSALMGQFVSANAKRDDEPKPSLSTVEQKSSPNQGWDFKHQASLKALGENLLFVLGNTAHEPDDIGNMTWGYIMSSFGFSRATAHAGAGWPSFETYHNWGWCLETGCDDPRDYQNIEAGYTWQETGKLPGEP